MKVSKKLWHASQNEVNNNEIYIKKKKKTKRNGCFLRWQN